jgi:hypothetical protein
MYTAYVMNNCLYRFQKYINCSNAHVAVNKLYDQGKQQREEFILIREQEPTGTA